MSDVEVMPLMSDKPGDKTSKTSGYQKPGFSTIIADITQSQGQSWLNGDAEATLFILYTVEFSLLDDIDANGTSKLL